MKKKDLEKIAGKIARAERTIRESSDEKEIANAKMEIMRVSESVQSLEDMMLLDDLIQEKLKKILTL